VLFEIDINEKGEVDSVRAVDGQNRNMFEREARRAVEQYRYKPFTDAHGQPIKKLAHQVRVEFTLKGEELEAGT
jgi:periplasmic protein TonB